MPGARSPSKHVVIVGGMAGGMSCATRLRRLDENARITVLEKGPFISYASCGLPYALGNIITNESCLNVETPEKIASWFNINVATNAGLASIDKASKTIRVVDMRDNNIEADGKIQSMSYDKLVLALGAASTKPPIEGIEHEHVFTLQTIPQLQQIKSYILKHHCQSVAVIGGGFIGLEAAENLRLLGMDVTVLEYLGHVLPPIDRDMAVPLEKELIKAGVKLVLNARISGITSKACGKSAQVLLSSHQAVDADIVIVTTGVRPRSAILEQAGLLVGNNGAIVDDTMQTSDPDIYAVGDLVETNSIITDLGVRVALAGPASRQGRIAADHICGLDVRYRGSLGTAICKVFDLTIAIAGLSVEALQRSGYDSGVKYVTIHPLHHAGYYPGAEPLKIKVAFDCGHGRLLGAQVVGKHGVDKRIDVLAMALLAGMSIEDLEHVELSYAPPFGSAKDPVNMAGFVGGNLFRGSLQVVDAEDLIEEIATNVSSDGKERKGAKALEAKYQIVDVRSPQEYAKSRLHGAINIPIGDLRVELNRLDWSRTILVYCWVGYRGYLAYRILKQNGFDAVNLNGGLKALLSGGYEKLVDESEVSNGS